MMRRSPRIGNGSMLRSAGRVVGAESMAAAGKARPPAKPARAVSTGATTSVSSPPSSSPSSVAVSFSPSTSATSENRSNVQYSLLDEWEDVGEDYRWEEEERVVFGPPPTMQEAEEAVAAIQQIFVPYSYSQAAEGQFPSPSNGMNNKMKNSAGISQNRCLGEVGSGCCEPSHLLRSRPFSSPGHNKVMDAFHLLQTNSSIKRMVISLASDKAVWDAVMKNEAVQQLGRSLFEAGSNKSEDSDESQDVAAGVLQWMLEIVKAKIFELVDNIGKLMHEFWNQSQAEDEDLEPLDAALRSSFMLSVMVFIIVVVARVQRG